MPQVLWVQGEEWGRSKEEREKQKANKQALQYLHQQGDKKASTPYLLKKKNDKVVAIKVNKQANNGAKHIGARGDYFQHEEHQEGLDPEGEVRSSMDFREFGDMA